MHIKQKLIFLLSTVSLAAAQSVSDIPSCASTGALQAIGSSGCSSTDIACICKSNTFTSTLEQYAKANCSPQDYTTTVTTGQAICAKAGVAVGSNSSSAAVVAAVAGTTSSNSDSASTASSASAAPSSSGNVTVSPAVIVTTKCTCQEVKITPTSTPVATYTGAAIRQTNVEAGGVAAGMLAVLELLAYL